MSHQMVFTFCAHIFQKFSAHPSRTSLPAFLTELHNHTKIKNKKLLIFCRTRGTLFEQFAFYDNYTKIKNKKLLIFVPRVGHFLSSLPFTAFRVYSIHSSEPMNRIWQGIITENHLIDLKYFYFWRDVAFFRFCNDRKRNLLCHFDV